jgi:hypothetical protein
MNTWRFSFSKPWIRFQICMFVTEKQGLGSCLVQIIHQVFSQSFLTVQFFYTAVALFFLTTTTVYHPEGHSSRWVICILTSWCADHLGFFPLLLFSCSYLLIFQASLVLILSRLKPKVLHGPNINNPLDLVLSCLCFCKIDFPAWQTEKFEDVIYLIQHNTLMILKSCPWNLAKWHIDSV